MDSRIAKIFIFIASILIWLAPVSASAAIAVPWFAPATNSGFISPGLVNGSLQGIVINAASSTFTFLTSGLVGNNQGSLYSFASSSLFGYTPVNPTRQLTISGTAGQITSSAGTQDLSADRTWTLSLSNHVVFPAGGYESTIGSTTNATTTQNLYLTGLGGAGGELGIDSTGKVYKTATTTFSSPLLYSAGNVTCQVVTGSNDGCLSHTDWNTFNGKLSVYDAFTHPSALVSATTSGLIISASSTIGNGLQAGGLSISGGATTTGFLVVQGNATSTFTNGIQASYLNLTGSSATNTASNGLSLSGGCFAYNEVCLTSGIIGGGSTQAVNWATTGALPSNTYLNGTGGVGATITEVGTGALSVDSNSPAVGDRVLVKNEATQTHNGIYTVTATGSGIASVRTHARTGL